MPDKRPITFEDIATIPAPGMNAPVDLRFSPDSRLLTYLVSPDVTTRRELRALDLATGDDRALLEPAAGTDTPLTREEELRRERQRQYATGVTGHAWSERGTPPALLVKTAAGALVVRDGRPPVPVGDGPGCIDPQLAPDGSAVAYVRDGDLFVQPLTDGAAPAPRRLTFDASPADAHGDRDVTNGLAEFVAQEEMGRFSGFWWSPDGSLIAFEQVDSRPVPPFLITHLGTDGVEIEAHRYPFAGQANVRVRLGVVPVAGGPVRWLSLGDDPEAYLARVNWSPDGQLWVQVQPRDQHSVTVRRIDPATGEARELFADRAEPWWNLHDDLRFVHRDGDPPSVYDVIWTSERTGRREVYLLSRDGVQLRQVTHDGPMIDAVAAVDAGRRLVYFHGWDATPLERHLLCAPLDGSAPPARVTREPGTHGCAVSRDGIWHADLFHSATASPRATVRRIDGGGPSYRPAAFLPPDPRLEALDLPAPEFITVATDDGDTLYGMVYRPRALPPGAKAPVVVNVYGGPHVQLVTNGWGSAAALRSQRLAAAGFLVLTLDNRGSARRGLVFEGKVAGNLGDVEVRDQVSGVRALARFPEADRDRVGVYGWSYGGYMALMCLARAPEVFKAGVAGAPVTAWDGYDTHYTERYMGLPDVNVGGYHASAVMTHAARIRGRLLIVHGMIDENVHFRHTGRLVNALIRAGIPHETLFFPEERHGPRRLEDRVFLERRIADFLADALR